MVSEKSLLLFAIEEPLVLSVSCFSEAQPLSFFCWRVWPHSFDFRGSLTDAWKGTWAPIWIHLKDYCANVARWVCAVLCAGNSPSSLGSVSFLETPNKLLPSKLCYFSAELKCSLLQPAKSNWDYIAPCSHTLNVANRASWDQGKLWLALRVQGQVHNVLTHSPLYNRMTLGPPVFRNVLTHSVRLSVNWLGSGCAWGQRMKFVYECGEPTYISRGYIQPQQEQELSNN